MTDDTPLSASDLARLMATPSSEARATTASKLASSFMTGNLSDTERSMAEDIFRLLARDVEVKVRKSLAESIKLSHDLPHDIAMAMANDVAEVALPVLEASTILSDEDLLTIIANKPVEYQIAVAARPTLSEEVSDALVATDNENVVARLMSNDGAQIAEETYTKVLDKFGHVENIVTPMATRSILPVAAAERLVNLVSERIRDHLVTHHQLPSDVAMDLILSSRERATLSLLSGEEGSDLLELVDQLARNGRLTSTIILRALCMGDLTFFETALARRGNVSISNAYQLIHDRGGNGLMRLFEKAKMPAKMLPVVRSAIAVIAEVGISHDDRQALRTLVLERVLTQFEDDMEDMDYLISKLATGPILQAAA